MLSQPDVEPFADTVRCGEDPLRADEGAAAEHLLGGGRKAVSIQVFMVRIDRCAKGVKGCGVCEGCVGGRECRGGEGGGRE